MVAAISPNTVVGGDFRIVRPLSSGGMGTVYLAEQLSTATERAVKIMHDSLVDDPEQRARFVREARLAARVRSEHVVAILGAGVTLETATPWLAMELLSGCDLSRFVKQHGALPLSFAVPIVEQICHGLGAAHAEGIVHRDLKPHNVFLCRLQGSARPWSVKLLDFGIAKLTRDVTDAETAALGSPAWMAPEQTEASRDLSPAADVWALGLNVYWMLTGRAFWRAAGPGGGGVESLFREMLFEPLAVPSVRSAKTDGAEAFPVALDDWFSRCLTRRADGRYRDADEAWTAFREAIGDDAPPSHVLPSRVARMAADASESSPADAPREATTAKPDPPDATAAPPTAIDGTAPTRPDRPSDVELAPTRPAPRDVGKLDAVPSAPRAPSDRAGSEEPQPTLSSHEVTRARRGATKPPARWLAPAALFAIVGAAIFFTTRPPPAEQTRATASVSTPSTPPPEPAVPIVLGIDERLAKAEEARSADRLDEAERWALGAIDRLGGVAGRRPLARSPDPRGARALRVLVRVALARAQAAMALGDAPDLAAIERALLAREPLRAEAVAACAKTATWSDHAEARCCEVDLARASLALAARLPSGEARRSLLEEATERIAASPRGETSCSAALLEARTEREQLRDASGPALGGPARPQPHDRDAALALVHAKASEAASSCMSASGVRPPRVTISHKPNGSVLVLTASQDDLATCVKRVMSGIRLPPFDAPPGSSARYSVAVPMPRAPSPPR